MVQTSKKKMPTPMLDVIEDCLGWRKFVKCWHAQETKDQQYYTENPTVFVTQTLDSLMELLQTNHPSCCYHFKHDFHSNDGDVNQEYQSYFQ